MRSSGRSARSSVASKPRVSVVAPDKLQRGVRGPGSRVRGPGSGEEYVMHRGTRPGQGLCIAYSHTAWIPPQGFVLAPFVALATTIRQTADPLLQNDRFSAFFAEWVCTLATTSPQVAASPPPNKGHCIIRDRTRRRNADSLLQMRRNPHHSRCGGHRKTGGHGCGARGRRRGLAAAPRSDGRHTFPKFRT